MISIPKRILSMAICTVCWFAACALINASAQDHDPNENPVRASMADDTVWIGQPTTLEIKLYSPGPFSGVPSFEFPEVSKTYILKTTRPTVSNEKVGEEEWFTQRYQFKVIVGRAGETVIPAFKVHFEGKRSFVADAEPMSGSTPTLRLQCKSPTAKNSNDPVVGASEFKVEQSWVPNTEAGTKLNAGEVVRRTITRRAAGSTAMSFPNLLQPDIEGVRVYRATPVIEDRFDSGKLTALRIDEVKYQFEEGGSFKLPAIEFFWWDYVNEKLVRDVAEGAIVKVIPPANPESTSQSNESGSSLKTLARWSLMIASVVLVAIYVFGSMLSRWKIYWRRPDIIAARQLFHNCRDNNAKGAYRAALSWIRLTKVPKNQLESLPVANPFFDELKFLTQFCYGDPHGTGIWNGTAMAKAFQNLLIETKRLNVTSGTKGPLLPLNPTSNFIRN